MCFQRTPNNIHLFLIVSYRPKDNNETRSFSNDAWEATCEVENMMDIFAFNIFATDGTSLECLDIVASSANFWRGNMNYNAWTGL